jgi:hypothetical protein
MPALTADLAYPYPGVVFVVILHLGKGSPLPGKPAMILGVPCCVIMGTLFRFLELPREPTGITGVCAGNEISVGPIDGHGRKRREFSNCLSTKSWSILSADETVE